MRRCGDRLLSLVGLAGEAIDEYLRIGLEKRERMAAELAAMEAELAGASEADRQQIRAMMCHEDIPGWLGWSQPHAWPTLHGRPGGGIVR